MTDTELRIAIAKELGWKRVPVYNWDDLCKRVAKQWVELDVLPNFCNSLDACAEFEATIGWDESTAYINKLSDIQIRDNSNPKTKSDVFFIITATARQRCEAFARLKGVWVE